MKLSSVYVIVVLGLAAVACQQNKSAQLVQQQNNSQAKTFNSGVIYGDDNRFDYFEMQNQPEKQILAKSTMALIERNHMIFDSALNQFHLENRSDQIPLCSTEKFRKQPQWAFCSGSLIADDLVLTAGHCITNEKECKETLFVFDYTYKDKNTFIDSVSAELVYSCSEIVYTTSKKSKADFALIRLDRSVQDRQALKLSQEKIDYKTPLMLIGHPAGYPTKFTLNGQVRSLIEKEYFVASVDSFAGNSGSSVFNQNTGEIIGVLARGETDYERKNSCYSSKICDENGCRGEDITRITEVIPYLPSSSK